jgi:hypothetical protein
MMKSLEKKMMQGSVRYSAIAAIIPAYLISVLISADNAAQARSRTVAVACGKELQQQCQWLQTTCSSASKRVKFPEDVLRWRTMLCACAIETQCSFARASSRVRATFLGV